MKKHYKLLLLLSPLFLALAITPTAFPKAKGERGSVKKAGQTTSLERTKTEIRSTTAVSDATKGTTTKPNTELSTEPIPTTLPLIPSGQNFLPSPAAPATGEQINWQVLSSGGGFGSSTNYNLAGTVGQLAVGSGSSPSYSIYQGFWQDFGGGGGCLCCIGPTVGNVDCAGIIDIGDVTVMIQNLFITLNDPCCEEEADVDQSGLVDIGDLTIIISSLFITLNDMNPCPC